ncbi:MAG: N-formylglutamate amidohydrolase [Tabrizicola sp.]|nr:N-formylglutamate amidohydrolase [Tabrizicola sp.]
MAQSVAARNARFAKDHSSGGPCAHIAGAAAKTPVNEAKQVTEGGGLAFRIDGEHRDGRWLVTCDHASNHVPDWVGGGDLGIPAEDMARHIAWDVGAAGVARELGRLLNSPVLLSDFSRLVIDPNRGEDDPTLVMRLYDGTIIPANRHADAAEVERRLDRLYRPYHAAYSRLAALRPDRVIVAIHSFTPCLRGRAPRPWHVGVLYSHLDERLSKPLIARLQRETDLCIGDNEPYSGHLPGDAIDRHALRLGRHNTLIEVRNDLIGSPEQQAHWAARLAPILTEVLKGL